jgi:hypothetical protein
MVSAGLMWGPLVPPDDSRPLRILARFCDVRARFLAKGKVGRSHRYIARNGRVLLATDLLLAELAGRIVEMRFQVWHRAILREAPAEPYGVLLVVRGSPSRLKGVLYNTRLVDKPAQPYALALALGGETVLEFTAS